MTGPIELQLAMMIVYDRESVLDEKKCKLIVNFLIRGQFLP